MTSLPKRKTGSRNGRLYHAAKISDYRFKKLLWHFVRDDPLAEAARASGVSLTSVAAIFRKLRIYFTQAGVFTDYYRGQDPREAKRDNDEMERRLLTFHFARVAAKRGIRSQRDPADYDFAESHWRFYYRVMMQQRPTSNIHPMMMAHLLEIIRLCGPVGTLPTNRKAGLVAAMRQLDQQAVWFERNAPEFRDERTRVGLREVRASPSRRMLPIRAS